MTQPAELRGHGDAHCTACGAVNRLKPARHVHELTRDRQEVTARGFDDFKQGAIAGGSADPLAGPYSTGIRIPPAPLDVAYRVLCGVAELDAGDMIVGIRQGIEIGAILGEVDDSGNPIAPMWPEIRPVTTYNWRFIDSAWAWTLTREPLSRFPYRSGPNDRDTFAFRDCSGSALVYETAAFPAVPIYPGYIGLDGYTPPAMRGQKVLTAYDLRWPFDSDQSNEELWIPVHRPERWRLYCDVLQTNPGTRNDPPNWGGTDVRQIQGIVPEDEFLSFCLNAVDDLAAGPFVWRAHGRLIVERIKRERGPR
jgi:hypothetical protein